MKKLYYNEYPQKLIDFGYGLWYGIVCLLFFVPCAAIWTIILLPISVIFYIPSLGWTWYYWRIVGKGIEDILQYSTGQHVYLWVETKRWIAKQREWERIQLWSKQRFGR